MAEKDNTDVTLAEIKADIKHGFSSVNERLDTITGTVKEHGDIITKNSTDIAILKATSLRVDAIRISAIIGATIVILGTVSKVAGLW